MPDYLKIRLSEGPQKMLCLDNRRTSTEKRGSSTIKLINMFVVLAEDIRILL
ncbi:hypothetical protein T06_5021 [Trichinella sp. T6]|nr:hypothetical protein T06_5021 [Trichinella sp. T6]